MNKLGKLAVGVAALSALGPMSTAHAAPALTAPFSAVRATTSGDRTSAVVSFAVTCPAPPTDGSPYYGTFLDVVVGPARNVWAGRDSPGTFFVCTGRVQTVPVRVTTYDYSGGPAPVPLPSVKVGVRYQFRVSLITRTNDQTVVSSSGRVRMRLAAV